MKDNNNKIRTTLVPINTLINAKPSARSAADSTEKNYIDMLIAIDNINIEYEMVADTAAAILTKFIVSLYDSKIGIELISDIATGYEYGVSKYYINSWKSVTPMDWVNALGRHLGLEIDFPGDIDDESGLAHSIHIMCNCMMILWNIENNVRF